MRDLRPYSLLAAALVLGACYLRPRISREMPDLGSDIELFGAREPTFDVDELLLVDEPMRAFAQAAISGVARKKGKLDRLMQALFWDSNYTIKYAAEHSFSASQTFHSHSGNCLSTTALLVALAREAGLDATFQDFGKRYNLRVDDTVWIHERHINAIVELDYGERVVVDFDRREGRPGGGTEVNDTVVIAQFFSNVAVNAMRGGEPGLAHANFRRSVELDPSLAYVWNNIGVLYRRNGHLDQAEDSLLYAISLDPDELQAMSNLADLYRQTNRPAEAKQYEQRLERSRRHNPHYLYTLAKRAYDEGNYGDSVAYLRRAIRIKDDEAVFHQLLQETESRQATTTNQPEG